MKKIIDDTIKILLKGGTILYPTDTIWGIGCDATNEDAVASVYAIKQRDENKSMLILVDSLNMLEKYVSSIPPIADLLIAASTHPLTIIYPKAKNIASNLIARDGSIGIRIVKNEFCKLLIHEFARPIVSTSANMTGHKSPLGFFDIDNEIKISVDYIVPIKLDELAVHRCSDIVRINKKGEIEVIR